MIYAVIFEIYYKFECEVYILWVVLTENFYAENLGKTALGDGVAVVAVVDAKKDSTMISVLAAGAGAAAVYVIF